MTEHVLNAMNAAGIKTDQLIWRMQYDRDGSLGLGTKGNLYLWTAKLSDADNKFIQSDALHKKAVTVHQYVARYDEKSKTITFDTSKPSSSGKSNVEWITYNGHNYAVIDNNRNKLVK